MALAVLYGAGSGALHAVMGPDHVLSLGPAALHAPKDSLGIGLRWGVGHALGTLLLSLPLVFAARFVDLGALAAFGTRLSGVALLVMGLWSYRNLRRGSTRRETHDLHRGPLLIGLVHVSLYFRRRLYGCEGQASAADTAALQKA